jgi:hypothetical protein
MSSRSFRVLRREFAYTAVPPWRPLRSVMSKATLRAAEEGAMRVVTVA